MPQFPGRVTSATPYLGESSHEMFASGIRAQHGKGIVRYNTCCSNDPIRVRVALLLHLLGRAYVGVHQALTIDVDHVASVSRRGFQNRCNVCNPCIGNADVQSTELANDIFHHLVSRV